MPHHNKFIHKISVMYISSCHARCRWLRCRSDVLVCPCIAAYATLVTLTPYRIDHSIHLQYIWHYKMICINWMTGYVWCDKMICTWLVCSVPTLHLAWQDDMYIPDILCINLLWWGTCLYSCTYTSCLVRWLRCRSDVLVCPCIGANAVSVILSCQMIEM